MRSKLTLHSFPPTLHSLAVPEQFHHFFPVGYHNMCRFYGGFAYSHPALKEFDYFWRLDSNVRYLCVPPFDPAQYVMDNDLDYGKLLLRIERCPPAPC